MPVPCVRGTPLPPDHFYIGSASPGGTASAKVTHHEKLLSDSATASGSAKLPFLVPRQSTGASNHMECG